MFTEELANVNICNSEETLDRSMVFYLLELIGTPPKRLEDYISGDKNPYGSAIMFYDPEYPQYRILGVVKDPGFFSEITEIPVWLVPGSLNIRFNVRLLQAWVQYKPFLPCSQCEKLDAYLTGICSCSLHGLRLFKDYVRDYPGGD